MEDKAVLMLTGIDDPKLDSTASHPSSSHSLPRRVVCHPGTLRRRLWVVWFYGFSAHTVVIRCSAVGFHFGFGYGYGRK